MYFFYLLLLLFAVVLMFPRLLSGQRGAAGGAQLRHDGDRENERAHGAEGGAQSD